MMLITPIVVGVIAGFVGSKLANKGGESVFPDIAAGIVGAVAGWWLVVAAAGRSGAGMFDLWSAFGSIVGAILILIAYYAVTSHRQNRIPLKTVKARKRR